MLEVIKKIFPQNFKNKIKYFINFLVPKNKKQIIFFSQPDLSDNSKAIYNEIVKNDLHCKYKLFWVVKDIDKNKDKLKHVKLLKYASFKSYIYFMRSKYIFSTHGLYKFRVNKRQISVNLWHGMPLKDIRKPKNEIFQEKFRPWKSDFVIATADIFKPILSEAFDVDLKNILITGLPRCDELHKNMDIKNKLNITSYNKIFLWMPTFRRSTITYFDGKESKYGLPLLNEGNLKILNDQLRKLECVVLIKMHQFAIFSDLDVSYSNIIIIDDEIFDNDFTLYNLIGNIDILLTDYSSVYIDFLQLNKPIGFIYDDFKEYNQNRSFVFDNPKDYMPGAHIENFNNLINFINKVSNDIDEYKNQRKEVNKLLNKFNDNTNALRVLQEIKFL